MKVKRFILTVAATIFVSGAAMASSYEDAIDAALNNRPDDLAPLLKQGFDPNTATPGGNADPLLSSAIRNKSYDVIDLLLNQKNIDLNKPNVLYETPLMLAIFYKENGIAKKLLAKGASVNNPGHWTPLHYAAASSNNEIIPLLLRGGADLNARTLRGITPLYMAARDGNAETVKLLLNAGARKDFCNNDALAPYDIAKQRQTNLEVLDLLKYDHCR